MKKGARLPAGGIRHVQKGLRVWMIAGGDGLLFPSLWDFTRRDVIQMAVRNQGVSWERLQAKGWAPYRVYIATIPQGFKIDVRLWLSKKKRTPSDAGLWRKKAA